jgi:hypothetical protein
MVKAGRRGIIIHYLSTNATDVVNSLICNRLDFRVLLVEDQIITESKNSILPRKMLPGPSSRSLTGSPYRVCMLQAISLEFPFRVIDNISNGFGKTRQCISHGKYIRGLDLFSFPCPALHKQERGRAGLAFSKESG